MAVSTNFRFFRTDSSGSIVSSSGGVGGAGGGFSLPSNLAYTNIQNTFSVEQNFNEEVRFLNSTGNTVYAKGEYPSSDPQLAFYHRTTGGGETQIIRFTETGVIVYGNLTVSGTEFIANTQTVLIKDNLLVINNGEVGAGVTAGVAGIQVDRGSLTDYQFLFDESSDTFRIGEIGSLQAVATREDSPADGNIMTWDATTSSLVGIAQSGIDLDYVTTNGNTTTNSITVNGLTALFDPIDAQGDFRARSNVKFDSYAPTSGHNLLQVGTDGTLFALPKSDIALQTDLANVAYTNVGNVFTETQSIRAVNPALNFITTSTTTTTMMSVIGASFVGTAPYNANRFVAANSSHLAFEAGGSEIMRVDSSGSVDITGDFSFSGTATGNGSGLTSVNAATLGGEALTEFMLFANPSDVNWTNGKVASYQNGEFVPVALPSASFTSFNLAATVGGSTTITDGETVTFVDGLNTTATRVGNTIQIDAAFTDTDTLDSVTDRGSTTTNAITVGGATINGNLTATGTITSSGTTGQLRLGTNPNDYATVSYSGGGTSLLNNWASTSAFVDVKANGVGLRVLGSGDVGIGKSPASGFKLDVNGIIRSSSSITAVGSITSNSSISCSVDMYCQGTISTNNQTDKWELLDYNLDSGLTFNTGAYVMVNINGTDYALALASGATFPT